MIVNQPVAFPGTAEEAAANYKGHMWFQEEFDAACWRCDAKPWHKAASYPCGEEPPRETVDVPTNRVLV